MIEPWLFSQEAEQFMLRISRLKHQTHLDVMNIMAYRHLATINPAKPRAGSSETFNFMRRTRDHDRREDPVTVIR